MAKKLLFIITQSEMGGAQKYVYETAINLDSGQYDITVAAGPKGNWELLERLKKAGVKTRRLSYLKRNINPLFDIMGILQVYRLIKQEKPDFVYLHSSKAGVVGSIAAAFYRGISRISRGISRKGVENDFSGNSRNIRVNPRIIYRIGGWAFNEKISIIKKWLYVLMECLTARLKDVIVVNTEADKKAAIERKICPERKIKVIYNGIDIDNMNFLDKNDARKSLSEKFFLVGNNGARFWIGTIANFYLNKGLVYLIEAARVLNNDNFIFIVIC